MGLLKELNQEQFSYNPIETDEDNPYAIPPFISSIPWGLIHQAGGENIKKHTQRWGLLGFIIAKLKNPKVSYGTNVDTLNKEKEDNLKETKRRFELSSNSGFVASYDDVSVEHKSISSDSAKNFKDIWNTIEEQLSSATDTDLFILGRNNSVTEAYAKVAGKLFLLKLDNLTHPTKEFIEQCIVFRARAKGFKFNTIKAKWKQGISLNPTDDATVHKINAETREITDRILYSRRNNGIIDNNTVAKEMGYDKAILSKVSDNNLHPVYAIDTEDDVCSHDHVSLSEYHARLSKEDEDSLRLVKKLQDDFLSALHIKNKDHVNAALKKIESLDSLDKSSEIISIIEKELSVTFPDSVKSELETSIVKIYKAGGGLPVSVDWESKPDTKKLVTFFTKANHFDIGNNFKYYEDEVKEAITDAIKSGDRNKALKQLQKKIPGILNNPKRQQELNDLFRNLTNRTHNFSRTQFFQDAGVKQIEVVAIVDKNTSSICKLMNGKTYDVSQAVAFVDKFTSTPYDDAFWSKFKNPSESEIKKNYSDLENLSGNELARRLNAPVPPFHYKCRTVVVSK
jgi:SPP1 gp7 family putative phage head morphogenesis protein